MGNDALVTRANGGSNRTLAEWYNLFQRAISQDLYPRASSDGTPTNETASLGSAAYRWKKLNAKSGEFSVGSIKWRMSYNGLVTPGHGWMLCDGRQIGKATYDAEHATGDWDSKIIASILEDKYLPDMRNRYLVGAAAVAQTGDSPITSIGAPGNLGLAHHHKIIFSSSNINSVFVHDNYGYGAQLGGAFTNVTYGVHTGGNKGLTVNVGSGSNNPPANAHTEAWSIDIRPESIAVLFYMRII